MLRKILNLKILNWVSNLQLNDHLTKHLNNYPHQACLNNPMISNLWANSVVSRGSPRKLGEPYLMCYTYRRFKHVSGFERKKWCKGSLSLSLCAGLALLLLVLIVLVASGQPAVEGKNKNHTLSNKGIINPQIYWLEPEALGCVLRLHEIAVQNCDVLVLLLCKLKV